MLNKKMLMVPLALLLMVGSLHAATVSFSGSWGDLSSLNDKRIVVDSASKKLSWYSSNDIGYWQSYGFLGLERRWVNEIKPNAKPSWLQFKSVNSFNTSTITTPTEVTLGQVDFYNQNQEQPVPNFTATLNLSSTITGLGQIPIKMQITNTSNTPGSVNDDINIAFGQSTYAFNVDGKSYTLTLLGFSTLKNGKYSKPSTLLSCAENVSSSYYLRASVAPNAVPIPATAWLLGSGLLGMLGLRRKAKN